MEELCQNLPPLAPLDLPPAPHFSIEAGEAHDDAGAT